MIWISSSLVHSSYWLVFSIPQPYHIFLTFSTPRELSLFCYQVPDLPRTNNDLEQSFGQVRFHERRATGRKGALPGLVVYGAVRVQAALASRVKPFTANELVPHDVHAWRDLRAQVSSCQQSRCKQWHFRKDPSAYLATLEAQLLKGSLRP